MFRLNMNIARKWIRSLRALKAPKLEVSWVFFHRLQVRLLPPSREENFDLSVVMPFYKKLEEFKRVLPKNAAYFQRNGIEVIVVMDEPSEEAGLLDLLKSYPFINWRVIVNDQPHPWRNPAKAINVGIRHAERSKILVLSPESLMERDVLKLLSECVAAHPRSFATGIVRFEHSNGIWVDSGSVCIPKEALEAIGAYDESYTDWGADDDDLKIRLARAGYKHRRILSARLFHTELEPRQKKDTSESSLVIYKDVRKSKRTKVNGDAWGRDFSRVSWDYRRNVHAESLCKAYLDTLAGYALGGSEAFSSPKKVVALIQSHNNPDINETLEHVAGYSDGIILLDDGSSDGTFEKADHSKLLVKAQKARNGFNDLENRNILLNIASFVPAEWFYFIDTDERFDERFETPAQAADRDADIILFKLIHLWDQPGQYRMDYPYTRKGISPKYRMFRNIGRSQIRGNKKLHFLTSPYISGKIQERPVLILHHGHLDAQARRRKFAFYTEHDRNKDQASYSHFLDEKVELGRVEDIQLER